MSVTDKLRRALEKRLQRETIYSVAKEAGVAYDTLHRFVHNPEQTLRSNNIDALCAYLSLELRTKRSRRSVARRGEKAKKAR